MSHAHVDVWIEVRAYVTVEGSPRMSLGDWETERSRLSYSRVVQWLNPRRVVEFARAGEHWQGSSTGHSCNRSTGACHGHEEEEMR